MCELWRMFRQRPVLLDVTGLGDTAVSAVHLGPRMEVCGVFFCFYSARRAEIFLCCKVTTVY